MRSSLRKIGNSSAVIIPKPMLAQIGAAMGDHVEIVVEAGRIVIAPLRAPPRAGWAADAKAIAAAGDDALVWPEFANADDEALVW